MIIVGYEISINESPYSELIEVSRHEELVDAEIAMEQTRFDQRDNDNIITFFFATPISDEEFLVNSVVDIDAPLLPIAPSGEE